MERLLKAAEEGEERRKRDRNSGAPSTGIMKFKITFPLGLISIKTCLGTLAEPEGYVSEYLLNEGVPMSSSFIRQQKLKKLCQTICDKLLSVFEVEKQKKAT